MSLSEFNLDVPFPDTFPKCWKKDLGNVDFMMFRNLDHFKYEVSKIKQKDNSKCGMPYETALKMLVQNETDFPEEEQLSIRNLVRSNLHKRGLITEEVYENFRYSTDGTQVGVDIGKYANGEPDCVMTPSKQYIDFFYELYINISYPYNISNETIRKNTAKLLATIEELERQHIFIKVVLLLPIMGAIKNKSKNNYFASVPLFSHKDNKSVATMSSIVNDRLLRKFFFAVLENNYGADLCDSYGRATTLDGTMNIGDTFDEIEFFGEVVKSVGA